VIRPVVLFADQKALSAALKSGKVQVKKQK
jgi:hypothetical protein